jgi:hypothetical protein
MVKHIVFFKLSPDVVPENKLLHLKQLEEIFSPLGKELNYIIEYRTGINISEASHAWDFAIDSIFKNTADLERYLSSEEHLDAVRIGSKIQKTKAVIDYEY